MTLSLSVVIPTLNAARTLPATLASVKPLEAQEILIVDGGSSDSTKAISNGHQRITSEPGRGTQLKRGAEVARGDWLLFLHADTRLTEAACTELIAFIRAPANAARAAAFRLRFDSNHPAAARVAGVANCRSRWLALPYGDQGLLIHRNLYEEVGGYRTIPLMEDVNLIRRLGRKRLHLFESAVITSDDRYSRDGWVRRPLRNFGCLALYFLGVSPARIARLYA